MQRPTAAAVRVGPWTESGTRRAQVTTVRTTLINTMMNTGSSRTGTCGSTSFLVDNPLPTKLKIAKLYVVIEDMI